ncbi:MAG TPA: tetratricopeptide repeat protein [Anaerolineae bacterium]|nr:tetratricopeptide repeat protein [Anaerolineae bacterium]
MAENTPGYDSAETLRKNGQYDQAVEQFSALWEQRPSPMIGWRYAFCLRKLGRLEDAERVARSALEKFPNDKWTANELIWVLYDRDLKPAKEESDLGRVLRVASEIMPLNPEGLALQRVALVVMKVAKGRGRWDVVLEWVNKLRPQDLSAEPGQFDGKRGMSDRETWYVNRARALLELGRYTEAIEQTEAAKAEFPDDIFLARTAALATARSGDVQAGATKMRSLLAHPRSDWYVKADLADLEFQLGNHAEAYRLLCEAVQNPQDDQYKLKCFVTIARAALALGQPVVAAEHITLAKAIRAQESWSLPAELVDAERETHAALEAQGQSWPDMDNDVRELSRICRKRWREGVTAGLQRSQGTIRSISENKKFTFIRRDDGEEDVFVLVRDLPRECARAGARVDFALKKSFDRKKGKESVQAIDVRCLR